MEDEERLKKLEAGKAKLAQFRQRKAQTDGQNGSKKQKKKRKTANIKDEESVQDGIETDRSRSDEISTCSSRRGAAASADFAVIRTLHSGEIIKHTQAYTIEPESEISTTVEDYSSEVNGCSFVTRTAIPADLIREEEFGVGDIHSEHGMQHTHTQLEVMENQLAGKQQEIEELSREIEEMRAAYGTEGLQQLQEFEAAIKKRDDIITQLTTNLQQARKEKDETMREFLELTEQSQKLQIQFQHLQASEALRNSSHSCTAADLLQAKQQILSHQQQLEEQECLLKNYQIKNEEFEEQIAHLQEKIMTYEMEKQKKKQEDLSKLQEKETLVEELEAKLGEEEKNSFQLREKLSEVSKLLEELKEEISTRNQQISNMKVELTTYKQKERQCSDEIKQLMGTVEELQKRCYKDSQSEADIVQRMEVETQRRLAQLQAELDEMHGQQIVQMKQELIKQHAVELERRLLQQKVELEQTSSLCFNENVNKDQMHLMNIKINELYVKLQDADKEREKMKQELSQQMEVIATEKSLQQTRIEDLLQELNFSREQVQRAKQTIVDMECRLNETEKYQFEIEDLKTQLASASEFRKDLELKHEAEITNYKIKLEMLEKEKDAVLDRMAESQEAELERLRTNLLFSHEEELSRLKEDLEKEHMVNMESLKHNLNMHHKQQLDEVQNEMSQKIEAMQYEKDSLITKQNQLILEITNLKDLQQSIVNSKSEEMTLQIHELEKEIEVLRQEEKEKGTLEQEIQELQLKSELMQEQMREREDTLQKKCSELEIQNNVLKGENETLEEKLKNMLVCSEENISCDSSVSSKTEILDLQKRIEKLITENEQLKNQNSILQEDTERQKSAFSLTEKKLEASYKELQKECASLLKAKTELEENKKKQEAEYKSKLNSLNEKICHLESNRSVLFKTKPSGFEGSKEIKVSREDIFEAGEVVEKDATELMEKLQVTQREKVELSLRLSDISEQLKSKNNEICLLNEKIKSLKDEKEQVLVKCKELEAKISHVQKTNSNSNDSKKKCSKGKSLKTATPACEGRNKSPGSRSKIDEGINSRGNLSSGKECSHEGTKRKEVQQMLKPDQQSVVEHLHGIPDRLTEETSLTAITQGENNLQQQVDALKSEQTDLQLQMEAQRICLSLVYSAHVDQVCESLKAEKESALCSLKEELVHNHMQEMTDLKRMHQLELQTLKFQQADDEGKSAQRLIEKLNEAVTEECSRLVQVLCGSQNENSSASVEADEREQEILCKPAVKEKLSVELPVHRGQAQVPGSLCNLTLQERMDALLRKIMEEYSRLKALQTQLMAECKQVKEPRLSSSEMRKEEEPIHMEIGKESLQTPSQNLMDPTIQEYCSKQIGNLKKQLEEQHAQELEHLRSYFQQQLKESQERYAAELVHLQDKLHLAGVSSDHTSGSTDSERKLKEVFRKVKCTENLLPKKPEKALELGREMEMQNDLDVVQLLQKQYQERLEEEVAKVIVSMSVAFAKQTELSEIARQKEEEAPMLIAHPERKHFGIKKQHSEKEVDSLLRKATGKSSKNEEGLKSLCKELREESGEINSLGEQLHSNSSPDCILGQTTHKSVISEEPFSHSKGVTGEEIPPSSEVAATATGTEAASQLLLYEERLEDMRQELVRQYQEHQQATELLRQGHMQQMERQKENQDQLLAELESLKVQLAERVSMENDSLVAERERMLIEELESLKQHSLPGKERLFCELQNNSTQTENENENQNDAREPIFEHEDVGRKPDETPSALLSKERHVFQKANEKLVKILLEVVKTTVAMEETIGQHVLGLLDRSGKVQASKQAGWDTETEESIKPCIRVGYEKESCSLYHGSSMGDDDINMWSGAAGEGLLSQHLAESGMEIDPENEELILNISSRLQAAVEKLLEAINETSNQLEHAKITQTELMRESFKKQQEATEFIRYQEELQERLNEETKAREQLALELSKAEGLIDGYADEKAFLEKQLQEKIDVIDHLEQELLRTGNKLQELEAEQQQVQEEKELLSRQKDAMRAEAGPVEQQLLEETEKLMKEKIEVQRQAEKEYDDLQKQVKVLEIDLEEQVNRFIELEQEKNAELMDLRQQNQALEKQLEKTRKFLDEQAIDREHERDVFQQEIQKLEQQLKIPQRSQPVNEHQTREVEQLTNHLKEKTDKCSELLLSKEQLQRDIQERNEEIEKLECRIRELEQALIISADHLQKVEERKQFGTIIVKGELPLEVQLQAEREAVDRKEKEVTNLEEQLEQFREELENKNEEVQQLHMQLEIQRKESTTHLQELEQENKLFKDEMEILGLAIQKSEDAAIKDHHLVAGRLAHIMQEKDLEIYHLHEQIAKLQQQLEVTTDNKVIEEQNEHIRELEAQVECLKSDQERVKKKNDEEVEQLNDVIDKLQQELAIIGQKIPTDVAGFQEDADSPKHILEAVLAEKEALEKQVENLNAEASQAKNELEETKLKMSQLKQEISMLRKEHERITEKYNCALVQGGKSKPEDGSNGKTEQMEGGLYQERDLPDQSQLRTSDENAGVTISKMEIQLHQLQACIKQKDSELCQCYNEIKDMKEQSKAEKETLKERILELEKTLMENVAAALVSQVQLNAVQEQRRFMQEIQEASKSVDEASKNAQTVGLSDRTENEAESKLSLLTQRLSEMEDQLAMVNRSLELEKENVKVAQKEATVKEKRFLELQQLLEDVKEKHKGEIQKYIKLEEMQTYQVEAQLMESQKEKVLITELEQVKEEAAAAKEELSSYREKAEKLQQELAVKEASLIHLQEDLCKVKENLVQAEERLASYLRKDKEVVKTESKKDAEISCDLSASESTLTGNSSSTQTDKTLEISPVLVKNAEIQTDLQNGCSSEEIAEIVREFTEKIDQMQELHAAEIMDMETRHISESEALKREKFVAVQVLTEECNTLKEVIETLKAKESIPVSGLARSPPHQARDGGSSDSSSDWSQGMYLAQTQGSDTVSEGIDEGETSADLLPKKIKGLLRAVHHEGIQVLSLTEFPYSEKDLSPHKHEPESWLEERKAFLSTISSLKDLIAKMQVHREAEICASTESSEGVSDWRGELLHAIQQLFVREQNVLLAAFQTELGEMGARGAGVLMTQLEHRLQEQAAHQRASMDCLQNADRRSLLMEIQVLRAQMNSKKSNPKREQESDSKSQEMLEYNMQQKQLQILEMQVELRSMKDRAAELQEQLNSERMMGTELRNELAQAKLELEATLKAQHKHFKELETIRTEVKEKAAELDILKDTMADEQKKSRELQWALEKEKAKMERSEERGREELEDLKFSLEDQKQKNLELSKLLEQEKQLSSDLQQKIDSQEALSAAQLSRERGRNSELQVLLESEKVRALEISSALEREKELCAQLQSAEDKGQAGTPNPSEELLKELQKQMDEKHDRIVELVGEMEKYKLESVQVRQQMEKERQIQRQALQAEQDANITVQKKLHELESKVEDLQWQLGEKKQEVHKLGNETKKLQEIIQDLQKKEQEDEGRKEAERTPSHNPNETTWDTPNDRTRNWVLQQKMEGTETNELTYRTLTGELSAATEILEKVRQKLQTASPKLKQLAWKAASRLQFETADDQDFIAVQNAIEEVISELKILPGLSSLEELKLVLPPGTPSSSLTERLLRQNAELTGFVSRLSEEKNNLRNAVMKLEEELRRYQHRQPSADYSSRHSSDVGVNIDTLVASEKEIWNRERLSLQKSLKQADAELSKLRAELRSEAFLRELGSDTENAVLRRIYGKYLRAESFRKALIYQKKYLLLLLGGFQECEEATLALIARMGGQPSYTDLEIITHHSKAFTRFRSAVRVSIAISRMKFLVRRWHRVTGSGILTINRDVFSQNTGHELRPDSFSGGMDLYGEQRHSYRSRSGMESPRSPINFQHKLHGMHADLNPVSFACPQLQNYDPERALTDYINRLEALQKRLGSVQSGSTSYTQLHMGIRR
ncbi:A-kinase anchor protein 9 isoform X2 [Hirundo rustica]|uniref:A-kinase anchor protein 9 isoform X2 n=1 Tax=Hirundo rustica TaxID=43150 RepID=UPI001A93AF84|nr:A-kinase anchor protein 9 isoform X2 [Hirundo rustica]